jgi:hypothetical protein
MNLSRKYLLILSASVLALPVVHAQNSACQTVQFNDEVTQRFPRIREACLDVIERDGQQYAVFKGDLMRTGRNALYVRFKLPDGTRADTRKIQVSPQRRVLIAGKPVRVQDLAVGQELTAYVKVSEPVVALAPPENDPLDLQPLEPETSQVASAETGTMPHTASPVRQVGAAGLVLLVLGTALAVHRRFRPRTAA